MVTAPAWFDWKKPDYVRTFKSRENRLRWLREDRPKRLPAAKAYYRTHIAQFITDWGVTTDPRNVDVDLPALIPFVLFPRQEEWIEWFFRRWKGRDPGMTEKSRESGLSWLAVATAASVCLLNDGVAVGFGSRKQEYVDQAGSPKSLLEKVRIFIEHLPSEFRGTWQRDRHGAQMKIIFPDSHSFIGGEIGDEIGRGDRTAFYFVDEAAFLEHPELVDSSLSQTTRCRIDISTPNGMANTFAQRRFSAEYDGTDRLFTFHWRDDPRKDEAWYRGECGKWSEQVIAQEIDINHAASVEGVVIPSAWIQAAIGADAKLGIECTGGGFAALDVADEGRDANSLAMRRGVKLINLQSWSGAGSTIFKTVKKVFGLLDEWGQDSFDYDADGLGAGVRGDAEQINEAREKEGILRVTDMPFRGSAAVYRPEGEMVAKRKNKDYFQNLKAQSWWALRLRFEKTYKWVVEGEACDPDEIIVIDPALPELTALTMELSQPTWEKNLAGKIVINKVPDGARSPNRGDSVMILYNPSTRHLALMAKLAS
jgi:phage terminase large subunit